jgi:CRISPR-associated exonuclease Cas4
MVTGTEFAYFHICKRKLWLFSHGILMEQNYDRVAEGKLLHKTSYPRKKKEIKIEGCVIDNYDYKNHIIHEVKLTPAMSNAHISQLKYYIYVFKYSVGLQCKGEIDYPKLKRNFSVFLEEKDEEEIRDKIKEIEEIKRADLPKSAPVSVQKICKSCAYADYCFS